MPTEASEATALRRILLVEDEDSHARIIQRSFDRYGACSELAIASSLAEATLLIESRTFDLVITDWRLPDGEGFDLLKNRSRFPLLVMTSHGNEQIAVEAMRAGALDYIVKSDTALLDMPRIAEGAIRLWLSLVAKELAQGNLLMAEEALRESRRSDEILRESERSLRFLADAMPQIVWTARADGQLDYLNRQWYEIAGSQTTEDANWAHILHPDDLQPSRDGWYEAMNSGSDYEIQYRLWDTRRGAYRWHLARALPQRDARGVIVKWVGTATDIDDHKRLSEELENRVDERTREFQRLLIEKSTLLKEVHHRVKNNLQVVCSLLSMQINCSADHFAGPLRDAHARVLAMSLIHEQIYQSETLADLNFGDYVGQLAERLFSAYCVDASRIRLEMSVEAIQLNVDHAIPCGLILNELMANSLKHALGDGREGVIRVHLRRVERNGKRDYVELEVGDNGTGFPANYKREDSKSLGLQIVNTLIRQLRADLAISSVGGTTYSFSWKLGEGES